MSRPISRPAIVSALLRKELKAYSRDKVYLALTLVVLITIPVLFPLLPDQVDESITLAVSPPISALVGDAKESLKALGATDEQLAELDQANLSQEQEGLLLLEFDSAKDMTDVIEGTLEAWLTESGDLVVYDPEAGSDEPVDAERVDVGVGIAFPDDFVTDVATGASGVKVTVYSDADVPEEIEGAIESFVREASYQLAGKELPVTMPDEELIILGEDLAGSQITLQEKLRPLFLFMVLLMETFSMASLVSTEVLQRTVTAVLITPATISDFLTAKTVFGTLMSLGQALIVLAFIGGLTSENWSLVIVALIIGAMMFTGVALFVGAAGKDFMGQLFYSMMFTIPLLIPTFAVVFPGSAALWVQAIPSYPVINVLVGAFNYGATWADSWRSLAYAAIWLVVLFGAGVVALKRKVESL